MIPWVPTGIKSGVWQVKCGRVNRAARARLNLPNTCKHKINNFQFRYIIMVNASSLRFITASNFDIYIPNYKNLVVQPATFHHSVQQRWRGLKEAKYELTVVPPYQPSVSFWHHVPRGSYIWPTFQTCSLFFLLFLWSETLRSHHKKHTRIQHMHQLRTT
jgi:hypothetical protein